MRGVLRLCPLLLLLAVAGLAARPARAENASKPLGEPVLETPTTLCLGVYWIIGGDANANARITVQYRETGAKEWRKAQPLLRVDREPNPDQKQKSVEAPKDAWLFAGSVVLLKPDTPYEMKLTLTDPDGGDMEKVLACRTAAEPKAPVGMTVYHVTPGGGGGTGAPADPFKGLVAAQAAAKPGTLFLLHAGQYNGTFTVTTSGKPGQPIIWRGAGDGETILDGQGAVPQRAFNGISASDTHDVWYENLTVRNATFAIVIHESSGIVIRRCHLMSTDYGVVCGRNPDGKVRNIFISDNVVDGPCLWPRSKGIEDPRGIQVTGTGVEVCYNRVHGFSDALDTLPSPCVAAIDFHHNDCSECTDDGTEMDYSERNTRCFYNRYTNVFQGISTQPIFGGPVYIFRNVLYNVGLESFKMHNNPSGGIIFNNTIVKHSDPMLLWTGPNNRVSNFTMRNNLHITGTASRYAYECIANMVNCDFDYEGFGGGPWPMFLKWNGARYATLDEVKAKSPIYQHALMLDFATLFAGGVLPPAEVKTQFDPAAIDLRLKAGAAAIDAGVALDNFTDGFTGKAPDLGAYEFGAERPWYGPRK